MLEFYIYCSMLYTAYRLLRLIGKFIRRMSGKLLSIDLYQVLGPADISRKYQIPLDSVWHYGLSQEGGSQDFYRMPISAAGQSLDYRALGYWSEPFSITPGDVPVITYTVPLFDQGGEGSESQ